jgi:hypothetical protein
MGEAKRRRQYIAQTGKDWPDIPTPPQPHMIADPAHG